MTPQVVNGVALAPMLMQLHSQGAMVSHQWLLECLQFLEQTVANYTNFSLDLRLSLVAEQWLEGDLRGNSVFTEGQSFPNRNKKGTWNRPAHPTPSPLLITQVVSCTRVDCSIFSQNVTSVGEEHNEFEDGDDEGQIDRSLLAGRSITGEGGKRRGGHRVVHELVLSDGFRDMKAMEYAPFIDHSNPPQVGEKILLRGWEAHGNYLLLTGNLAQRLGGGGIVRHLMGPTKTDATSTAGRVKTPQKSLQAPQHVTKQHAVVAHQSRQAAPLKHKTDPIPGSSPEYPAKLSSLQPGHTMWVQPKACAKKCRMRTLDGANVQEILLKDVGSLPGGTANALLVGGALTSFAALPFNPARIRSLTATERKDFMAHMKYITGLLKVNSVACVMKVYMRTAKEREATPKQTNAYQVMAFQWPRNAQPTQFKS